VSAFSFGFTGGSGLAFDVRGAAISSRRGLTADVEALDCILRMLGVLDNDFARSFSGVASTFWCASSIFRREDCQTSLLLDTEEDVSLPIFCAGEKLPASVA
jgi:hypothetical protein